MHSFMFLTLLELCVLPCCRVGVVSLAFLSPYSPFADGGVSKEATSTEEDKQSSDTATESISLNYINNSLASSLSYPRRLVNNFKHSTRIETNDEIETSDSEVESLLYAPKPSHKVNIQASELNISSLSNPCRLGKADTPSSRIHSKDSKDAVNFKGGISFKFK